jgi:hypothetical protein
METKMFVAAILTVIFLVLIVRLNRKIKNLDTYKKNTIKVSNCLAKPESMVVSSTDKGISYLTCIQGSRYRDIVDKYRLGKKAYPLQRCMEDNINFRLMANAFGENVCLSVSESNEIINDLTISSLAKDCLVDDTGLPDTTKSFVVDSDGMVGCIDTLTLVNNYLNNMSTPAATPVVTSTPI